MVRELNNYYTTHEFSKQNKTLKTLQHLQIHSYGLFDRRSGNKGNEFNWIFFLGKKWEGGMKQLMGLTTTFPQYYSPIIVGYQRGSVSLCQCQVSSPVTTTVHLVLSIEHLVVLSSDVKPYSHHHHLPSNDMQTPIDFLIPYLKQPSKQ